MGPLGRLRWFGFVCPCHESDVEYNARMGAKALQSLPIQWLRTGDRCQVISVEAVLSLVDDDDDTAHSQHGPSLQVRSQDAKRFVSSTPDAAPIDGETDKYIRKHTARETVLVIPLKDMHVSLVDTEYQSIIQVYVASNHQVVLQFSTIMTQEPSWWYCYSSSRCCQPLPPSPQHVVDDLQAVLDWDSERRADIQDRLERLDAAQRLRDEQQRLVNDADAQQAVVDGAHMAMT